MMVIWLLFELQFLKGDLLLILQGDVKKYIVEAMNIFPLICNNICADIKSFRQLVMNNEASRKLLDIEQLKLIAYRLKADGFCDRYIASIMSRVRGSLINK